MLHQAARDAAQGIVPRMRDHARSNAAAPIREDPNIAPYRTIRITMRAPWYA